MLELRAIGNAEIQTETTTLTPSQEIVFASALYLVLQKGKKISRNGLAELLWPSVELSTRRHRLRQTLLQLKRLGVPMSADRDTVSLSAKEAHSDLEEIESPEAGTLAGSDSLEFLSGYSPRFSEPFRDWIDSIRSQIHSRIARALLVEIQQAREAADWSFVEQCASKCISVDPYNETAILAKAEATAMRGAKRDAVRMLDRFTEEVGSSGHELKLQASLLRRRINARIEDGRSTHVSEPLFVGRDAEMRLMTHAVSRAREGNGGACLITGDPGIGKSRLAQELSEFAALQGVQVQRVSCRRSDIDRPLSVFADLVPPLRELPGSLGCSQETLGVLKRLTEFDGRGAETAFLPIEDLGSLIGNTRRALFDLLDALVEEQCLLIVVDDVQWLDRASSSLFIEMIAWASKKKLLFLFSSRPQSGVFGTTNIPAELFRFELRPLSTDLSLRLLQATLDAQSQKPDTETLHWLLTAGDGNPFFLQELAKRWLETGHKQEMPPSLATVLDDRLSRLTPEAMSVLQACAVLDENSTLNRVEGVLEYKSHQLLTAIQDLSVAGMLAPQGLPPGEWKGAIRVKHDLLSIAAVAKLSPTSLAFLHRRSGSVLEREISGERSHASILWACAFHWGNAGDRGRALAVASSCAEHVLEVGLPQDAVQAFERALEYCSTDQDRLGVYSRMAVALQMDSQWAQSKTILTTCRRLRQEISPGANQHDDVEIRLYDATWRGSLEHRSLLHELLACAETQDASATHRVDCGLLGLKVGTDLSETQLMTRIYETIKPLLETDEVAPRVRYEVEMVFHSMCGDADSAMQGMERLVGAARAERNPLMFARTLGNAAIACRLAGRMREAVGLYTEAVEYALGHGLYATALAAACGLIRVHLATGEFPKARLVMDRAETFAQTGEDVHYNEERVSLAARLALEEGNYSEALALYEGTILRLNSSQTINRRTAVLALGVRIGIKAKLPAETLRETVHHLHDAHLASRSNGLQDFEAVSLYLGLAAIGRHDEANVLLREYVDKHRREKWPVPQEIAEYLAEGATAQSRTPTNFRDNEVAAVALQ